VRYGAEASRPRRKPLICRGLIASFGWTAFVGVAALKTEDRPATPAPSLGQRLRPRGVHPRELGLPARNLTRLRAAHANMREEGLDRAATARKGVLLRFQRVR
jgi:hypothetical protein